MPEEEAAAPPGEDAAGGEEDEIIEHHPLVIVGGGIGGLVLALCLDQVYNHPGDDGGNSTSDGSRLPIHVYESTAAYTANAGGAIGLYSNGLRVLRHLSNTHPDVPTVLSNVREAGCDYLYRRWMRHDGLEVAVAREDELLPDVEMKIEGTLYGDADKMTGEEDERSLGSASTGSTASSNSRSQSRQGRPRGDSIASQDKEGERADRRPRGGSFGNLRDHFRSLTAGSRDASSSNLKNLDTLPPPQCPASSQSPGDKGEGRPKIGSRQGSLRNSLNQLTEALSNIVPKTGEDGTAKDAGTVGGRTPRSSRLVETELLSLGIRRWKYQQVLYEACVSAGIHIHFGKRLQDVTSIPSTKDSKDGRDSDARTLLQFKDGSKIITSLLIGADGINSKVRNYVTNPTNAPKEEYVPAYTGVTCLMGCANVPRIRGICFPSSATTKCHACYYPTRAPREGTDDNMEDYEQVFQIYFPSPVERPDTWRTLTPGEAKEECRELAKKLREDGWDEQFLRPLESPTLTGVLRVGLRSREGLDCWHVGGDGNGGNNVDGGEGEEANRDGMGRAVLLGDAAHPPVPYIGQGAMMAMEDAGTLSMVLARFCPKKNTATSEATATLDLSSFKRAMSTYESLRVSRTKTVLGSSVQLGKTQQKRAESKLYNAWREWSIKAQVWAYGTLPVMRPGAAFDYRSVAEEALRAAEGDGVGVAEAGNA